VRCIECLDEFWRQVSPMPPAFVAAHKRVMDFLGAGVGDDQARRNEASNDPELSLCFRELSRCVLRHDSARIFSVGSAERMRCCPGAVSARKTGLFAGGLNPVWALSRYIL
jgi:hypothetical protein